MSASSARPKNSSAAGSVSLRYLLLVITVGAIASVICRSIALGLEPAARSVFVGRIVYCVVLMVAGYAIYAVVTYRLQDDAGAVIAIAKPIAALRWFAWVLILCLFLNLAMLIRFCIPFARPELEPPYWVSVVNRTMFSFMTGANVLLIPTLLSQSLELCERGLRSKNGVTKWSKFHYFRWDERGRLRFKARYRPWIPLGLRFDPADRPAIDAALIAAGLKQMGIDDRHWPKPTSPDNA